MAVWGDRDCPLDEAGVREKFIAYASPSLGIEQSQKLADSILEGSLDQGLDMIWSS